MSTRRNYSGGTNRSRSGSSTPKSNAARKQIKSSSPVVSSGTKSYDRAGGITGGQRDINEERKPRKPPSKGRR